MEKIALVLGDWSQDGHNKTETVLIESNLSKKEIEKAYQKGAEKAGISICDCCEDYEDNQLSPDQIEKLEAFIPGLRKEFEKHGAVFEEDEDVRIYTDEFTFCYLETVKFGNPKFKYKIVKADSAEIQIGGYGLFTS